MAKDKVTVTIDPAVLANADEDAAAAGMNRSEYVERLLIEAHYRRLLARAEPTSMAAGDEDELRALLRWQAEPGAAA
jgi:hypothetical protein